MMVMTMVPSIAFAGETTPDDIPITEEYFPDENLRAKLFELEQRGEWEYSEVNGILDMREFWSIGELTFDSDEKITNLEGLQYFTYLRSLNIKCGDIDSVSCLPKGLEYLTLENCNLTSLDISHLPNLYGLNVKYNYLSSVDDIIGYKDIESYEIDFWPQGGSFETIPIDEEHFPDDTLREIFLDIEATNGSYGNYDGEDFFYIYGNGNGVLEEKEVEDITWLYFDSTQKITNLQGLQYITNLKTLKINNGKINSVSCLPNSITHLDLKSCGLTSLDVSHLNNLKKLDVRANNIPSIDNIVGFVADEYDEYGEYEDYHKYIRFYPQGIPANIPIDKEHFPDDILRAKLVEMEGSYEYWFDENMSIYLDCNGDGIFDLDELNDFTSLYFKADEKVTNLEGLQYLYNLKNLGIESGEIASVSCLPSSIISLTLKRCGLTSLDVSHLPNLQTLNVRYNNIPSLDAVIGFEGEEYDEDKDYEGDYKYIKSYPQGQAEAVAVDENHFPDKAFREYVSAVLDDDEDGILSVSEIENVRSLSVYDRGIQSLEGLQYFPYIKSLDCSDNFLTELSDLPKYVTSLECDDNLLSELPALPDKLDYLRCEGNKLTVLPELPDSLTYLYCPNNNLTSLPELPKALTYLHCGTNKLTSLPSLSHTSITELQCYENQINILPNLPDGIKEVCCSDNKIKELPELPATIEDLDCSDNVLTKLPSLPLKLKSLDAQNNKLTGTLNISQQMFLKKVYLEDNILTGLIVSDKAKYEYVSLYSNNLASKNAVTGRSDIDWDNVFQFGTQKTYCEVHGHDLSKSGTSKAYVGQSYSYDGSKYKICSKCGYETRYDDKDIKIPAVNNIKLSATSYTYNGKAKKPTVTVYDNDGNKISSSNYTVSYASGRKNVGKYKVTVKFKGNYDGRRYVTFKINPKGTSISKLSKGKKSFTVKWKKQSSKMAKSRITGYQYRYSTSSKMTNAKTITVKGYSKISAKKTGLKAKKKYYVQVRTYMTVSGTKYYSSWSKTKSVTTK